MKGPHKYNIKVFFRSYLVYRYLLVDSLASLICLGFAILAVEDFELLDFESRLSVRNIFYQLIEGVLKSLIRLILLLELSDKAQITENVIRNFTSGFYQMHPLSQNLVSHKTFLSSVQFFSHVRLFATP